jgi:hypothetical protein
MRRNALITFAIAAVLSLPSQAALVYRIVDHNQPLADPLDKGFKVAGTITASTVGVFTENDSPFEDWNITVTVPGPLVSVYNFTPANSSWQYDTAGGNGLGMLEVTESFIWLKDIFITDLLEGITTTLVLESPSLNQQLGYVNLGGSSFIVQSAEIGGAANGSYVGGGGDAIVAFAIPELSSTVLLLSGVVGLVATRRRDRHS